MIQLPARIFITGTGTGIGKTVVSAIVAEALHADYWKPVQAGFDEGTDSEWVRSVLSNEHSKVHPEKYKLKMPASPHIAAREENIEISLQQIADALPQTSNHLVIEGAGGLMVPLNEKEFVADLITRLKTPVILVSRNLLGSINHSILTAESCKQKNIPVLGWIFNDNYLQYEDDIVRWTGISSIASVPHNEGPGTSFVFEQAQLLRPKLVKLLC